MKVAVSAQAPTITSSIDPRFGRAPWFVIVDTDTKQVELLDNQQGRDSAHGAGIQTAENIIQSGTTAVVTGNVGPNAYQTLTAAGVRIYLTYAGTVQGAVDRLAAGKLSATDRPSRQGHG